jgi:hypothetical protein
MKSILFPMPSLFALVPLRRRVAGVLLGLMVFWAVGGSTHAEVKQPSPPDAVLGVVRASAPKQLLPKIMNIARQVQPGPQTEALPFILGGLLGDPMLNGISATENMGMVLLGDLANQVPVILLKLPEASPLRTSLPGFGMQLEDRFGWTFMVPEGYSLSAIDGREEQLIAEVRQPRRYDLEMAVETAGLVALLREGTASAAIGGSGDAFLEVLAAELETVRDVGIGFNLAAKSIDQAILVRALAGSAMALFLDQKRTGDLEFARFIEADGAIGYLGGLDQAVTLGYLEHLAARLASRESDDSLAMVGELLESARKSIGTISGASAGIVSMEGMMPRMTSMISTTMDDEALQEFLRQEVLRSQKLMEVTEDDGMTYSFTPHAARVGEVSVHRVSTEWKLSEEEEAQLAQVPGMLNLSAQQQNLYWCVLDGLMVTANTLERTTGLIEAIQAGEPVENNLRDLIPIRDETLFEFQMDLGQYLGQAISLVLPGMGGSVAQLQSRTLPPMKGWVAARGGEGEMMFSLPIETIIILFQTFAGSQ